MTLWKSFSSSRAYRHGHVAVWPVSVAWLCSVLAFERVAASFVFGGWPPTATVLEWTASLLGVTVGVLLARQGRTGWVMLLVLPVAVSGTVVYELSLPTDPAPEYYFPVLNFAFDAVVLAATVYLGALPVAGWRR